MGLDFKRKTQELLARILFPTTYRDWFKEKGYGKQGKDSFEDFLEQQYSNSASAYHKEFQGLTIKREFISCLDYRKNTCELDSISFSPNESELESGKGAHIVNFFGRLEYYECNFRDMAREAHATGATIHAFNPPGMNSSTGKVYELKDLVNSGIAQINKLLKDGVHPDKIILQGNCMGAAVAEEVNAHFNKTRGVEFRRINSNSFKSMNALLTYLYPSLSFVKAQVKKILEYTGWQSTPGKLFQVTSPYKAYMSRKNDKTIMPDAKMKKKIEKMQKKEELNSEPKKYVEYEVHRTWLDERAEMVLDSEHFTKDKNTNQHELDLYKLKSDKDETTAYDFINYYIKASNEYVQNNPQEIAGIENGAPYLLKEVPMTFWDAKEKTKEQEEQEECEITEALDLIINITGSEIDQTPTKLDHFEELSDFEEEPDDLQIFKSTV